MFVVKCMSEMFKIYETKKKEGFPMYFEKIIKCVRTQGMQEYRQFHIETK